MIWSLFSLCAPFSFICIISYKESSAEKNITICLKIFNLNLQYLTYWCETKLFNLAGKYISNTKKYTVKIV